MNEKLQESVQYLRYCNIIENEAFSLYETLSKKINQPESSFVLGLAYDSLKNAKVIQGILDYFDLTELENKNVKKNLAELASETAMLSKKISKINNLDYLISCEMLRESINLEDLLSEVYTNYLQLSTTKNIAEELSKLFTVNLGNFKKVFEDFVEEKSRHRGTLIEIVYSLEAKETETHRQITPIVKYQNPDAWIHESTIHSFSNTPVTGSTEP
jgi:rubrerythrin